MKKETQTILAYKKGLINQHEAEVLLMRDCGYTLAHARIVINKAKQEK